MRVTKAAMVALYVVMATTAGIVGSRDVSTYWQLLQSGRSTDAVVLRTNCDIHGSVFYKFEVEGRQYEDGGNAGFGTPGCRELKPGDRIVVYYLPSNPDVSVPGEIKERWINELTFLGLAVPVMPAIFVYIVWRHLPRRYRLPQH